MEHIPTKYIKDVLHSFHKWTKKYLFLQIALVDDFFGEKVVAQFWDLVGAERFNFLRSFCYKGANCLILVVDLTRPNTLENVDYFVRTAKAMNINPDQIILVGTKVDLFYLRCIDSNYLATYIEKYGFAELIET